MRGDTSKQPTTRAAVSRPSRPRYRGALLAMALACAGTACAEAPAARGEEPRPEVTATLPLADPAREPSPDASGDGRQSAARSDGMTVVLDPGHNGGNAEAAEEIGRQVPAGPAEKACDTVGARTADGYDEHEFTFALATLVRERLEDEGITVELTREDNAGVGPCIDERARIGNEASADAAVSIHADGGPPSVRGFHVIAPERVSGYTDDIADPSLLLARDLRDRFHEVTGRPYAGYVGEDGIDLRDDLGGLNLSDVPKVFLEAGNMRNAEDAELLTDERWRRQAADAVAEGVIRFLDRR